MLRPPDVSTQGALADWVEISLLALQDEPFRISDAEISDAIQEYGGDAESDFASLKAELDSRIDLLGGSYPVSRDGQGYARTRNRIDCLLYYFLLLVSLNQHYSEMRFVAGQLQGAGEIFENLVLMALTNYVGGQAMRLGGTEAPSGVPTRFPRAVAHLATATGEEFGYGDLEHQESGDDGLDIVAWKPHRDKKPSQLIVLAQCAVGTNWTAKRSELDLEVWRHHIHWHTQPIKALQFHSFTSRVAHGAKPQHVAV